MTITASSGIGAMPQSIDYASQLQPLVAQLQSLSQQLTQLVATLSASAPAAGAATLGGGGGAPAGGCGCGAASGALQGASTVEQGADGGVHAAAATSHQQASTKKKSSTKQPTTAKQATKRDTSKQQADVPTSNAKDISVPEKNPSTVAEAIEYAKREAKSPSRSWSRLCLGFVARAFGWSASGTATALDNFRATPESMRHSDMNAPAGALLYWKTSSPAGHVALSLGNGMVASNDIHEQGKISIVPASEITKKWGADYQGWTPPYFPNGVK